jgi:thiosulfate/3-mercaptopyruvate sulfurtransferase
MRNILPATFTRSLRRLGAAMLFSAALAASAAGAHAASPQVAASQVAVEPIVNAQWLNSHLRDSKVVVLDIRSAIDGSKPEAFAQGHIPGAVHSDYDKGGWRVERGGVPFMVPSTSELEKLIGELGIDEDSHVVVVPAGVSYSDFGAAARTYWTLKYAGLNNVSILDGGLSAWRSAGLPLEQGVRTASPAIFSATINKGILAVASDVEKIQASGGATLVDSRPASFFSGKEKAPASQAYGRIPGALSLDSATFYDEKTNRLKSADELAKAVAHVPAGPAVAYCNTGHWAATDWFVMHELLGRTNARLYAGSMVEWTSNASRPVESDRTKWDDLKKKLGLGS